ncbi:DNA-directed DNA polymerase eta NDAI_0A04080 [Naumovozyma dairenensis CBS 421]|uniref:UmuC domain-containing protein n=1 Tax=Naumovozyma dairenensis (strain ATCC 10597 / BCRC 20456 / CBS 421 / NBRC 0211 / NRRL Y-12639) TaxID=1071378 RepID=G0W427_NAUDC|nr:hypothetical protein NDAI_0A04080 [Naumovozyma dairenensis CBS 421]CCD22565.1 hypothetical protein NDAI_0A04080 [Naumovozyma dairenensis CBS 421]
MLMSKFTWNDLIQLNSVTTSYLSPLSCMAHIDVNAFFAQVEQIRCDYTRDDPVVCVQWNSIIAVSYAARKYGISRMDTIHEAMKKCDHLIPIHTAVFKKGESWWTYYDGYGSWMKEKEKQLPPDNYKVSLDPYRRESRKLFKIFKEYCYSVEKASVDEVFLDLGRLCFEDLMFSDDEVFQKSEAMQAIRNTFINGEYDLQTALPSLPDELKNLEFTGMVFNPANRPLLNDWDDIIFALASRETQKMRDVIKESLGYTTSCGIARTKNVAKLGSNFRKPDAQTIIKNNCLEDFLDNGSFEITSFWTLGGKLGKEICQVLNLPPKDSIKYIRNTWANSPKELESFLEKQLEERGGQFNELTTIDSTNIHTLAKKIFELSRGVHPVQLNTRPLVKSMMSNKNMRSSSCKSLIDCIDWLEVFSGELATRIQELEQEYNKVIIPRSATVLMKTTLGETYRKTTQLHNRDSKLACQDLLNATSKMAAELDKKYAEPNSKKFYPLTNMNLVISNFEILDLKKTVLDMFGNQAQVYEKNNDERNKDEMAEEEDHSTVIAAEEKTEELQCQKCDLFFPNTKEFQEHLDFHFASKLSDSLNGIGNDSRNLSVGEQRLLFSTKRPSSNSKRILSNGKKRKTAKGSGNILSFFSR